MSLHQWSDLSPRTRRVVTVVGAVDGALRIAALVDLKRRSQDQVNGPRRRWALALTVVNSAGLLPLAYFLRGRRSA